MAAPSDSKPRAALSLVSQEHDLAFYTRHAGERGSRLLLLGSANGRIAWSLAEDGHRVVAIDPSPLMIRSAEDRRSDEDPETSERVRFLTADLRSLRLTERFPLVLAPQHALGLMPTRDDLEAMIATVRHHLEPTGTFIYDVLNPPPEPARVDQPREPGGAYEPRRPVFASHLRERGHAGKPGSIRRLKLTHFSFEEIDSALATAGLSSQERYGNFEGKPFDPEDARCVGVAGL